MNRKEIKLKKLKNRYLNDNDLIISRVARKTIRYIEKNISFELIFIRAELLSIKISINLKKLYIS